ncbi:hypothetical protein H8S90_07470 [Olivibacter sp. SDN3]|uniref:hypothetical protein n=1 Tax=Olivibacter sp. SDN3 TaxID=2764720 RepID=UPI00165192E4|nr:hypothetical protein [Olivibacter sp. SDN3]QNL51406.1 hypothetical protein H8S90_07470 [Olivibacter sp. SDN3]
MENLPQIIKQFVKQLQKEIKEDVVCQKQSSAVYLVSLRGLATTFVVYRSLLLNVCHQEDMFGSLAVHIDEDLLQTKMDIVIARITAIAGKAKRIYARKTTLARIDKHTAMAFQQAYHLQVPLPGKYRYGLFVEGELMSVAVFSGGRRLFNSTTTSHRSFELIRFCHQSNHLVVGGLSRLIKGFIQEFNPGDIVTYVDRDWSDGKKYLQLGFTFIDNLPAQRFYVDAESGLRYHEKQFQKMKDRLCQSKKYTMVENLGSAKMRLKV